MGGLKMKRLLLSVAAAAMVAGCASNPEPEAPAVDATSPMYAPNYLSTAGSSDQFEIQSGQLAQTMSQNPGVRQIGQMLVTDHTNSTQQLTAAA
jgi:putative membrane protein